MRKPWSPEDVQYLYDQHITKEIPVSKITIKGRSEKSVEMKVMRIKKNGLDAELEKARNVGAPQTSSKQRINDQVDGNRRSITSYDQRITTLQDLIEVCEIDLDEWEIVWHEINKWEVGAKDRDVDLDYVEGKPSGHVIKGGIVVKPLFQVKARLVRREPVALQPVIQPVSINVKLPKKAAKKAVSDMQRYLFIQDPQVGFAKSLRTGRLRPFHDRAAMDVALQIAEATKPDVIVAGGDWHDLADWSDKFARSPNMYWTTQPSLLEVAWWLAQFRIHTQKMYLIEGNHEARMPKRIVEQMTEAFGLRSVDGMQKPPVMSIPGLLALDSFDVEWVGNYPNGEVWLNDYIRAEHGSVARAKSGATVTALLSDAQATTVVAHIHRIELAYKTVYDREGGRQIAVFCPGCLCRTDGIVPGTKERQNWQQGVGLIDYYGNGQFNIWPIAIHNGRAFFEDRVFSARDRIADLERDTKWKYAQEESDDDDND